MADDFAIDPKNKLGVGDWDDNDELADFIRALGGDASAAARLRARSSADGCGGEVSLSPIDGLELRATLSRYQ